MSQDYLNLNGNKEKEIIGQNYFDDLVRRSFLQDVEVDDENGNTRCKIHDFVHDFLQYLTQNECLIQDIELGVTQRKEVPNYKVHHLTLLRVSESDNLRSIPSNYEKLRTFIASPLSETVIGPLFELVVEMKCLRTLSLRYRDGWPEYSESNFIKIPERISGLIHLRYLDLSNFKYLWELPRTMLSFYNLQTLRLVECVFLEKVDVGMLINLRHLYVKGCLGLRFIKGIEKLAHLQTLDEFRVPGSREGNKLEDLKDLNHLQGTLTLRIKMSPNMAVNAGIMLEKPHLLQLKIFFMKNYDDGGEQRELMNELEPDQALKVLSIEQYIGEAFPKWLSTLHNLTVLTLDRCNKCKILPALGKLASLESLNIKSLDQVSKVGVEILGIMEEEAPSSSHFISFRKLKQLSMENMDSWEEWEGVVEENSDNITIMPCLSELTIFCCRCLKALPDFLWNTPLQELVMHQSSTIEKLYENRKGDEWAKICHIPTIYISSTDY